MKIYKIKIYDVILLNGAPGGGRLVTPSTRSVNSTAKQFKPYTHTCLCYSLIGI